MVCYLIMASDLGKVITVPTIVNRCAAGNRNIPAIRTPNLTPIPDWAYGGNKDSSRLEIRALDRICQVEYHSGAGQKVLRAARKTIDF